MGRLSDITRRENCFITREGFMLKNIKDLLDYLLDCDDMCYIFHVNTEKNDFAKWVTDTLLYPELGQMLSRCKNIVETRNAVMTFLQSFDYKSVNIPLDKAFHTVDDCFLKNLQELYYYINNCDDSSFYYHVNSSKNDFATWTNDVLLFPSLSEKMRSTNHRAAMIVLLKNFLLNSSTSEANPEYERYITERVVPQKKDVSSNLSETKTDAVIDNHQNTALNEPATDQSKTQQAGSVNTDSEEKIVVKHLDIESIRESEEKGKEQGKDKSDVPVLDTNNFRQFTDEELEKFSKFSKQEKIIDTDTKVEYLKGVLEELKNMVKELRRAEKDPLVADLLLRIISAKVDYYALSKSVDDYNHIIRLMKEVQNEIEECVNNQTYNIAEEIMKDLRLQGIALKKE